MAERATFIVDVITKGLKAARDQVTGLGKGAREAAAAYVAADKPQKDFYNTQAKGVIGTANSTKSFSKLAETMNNSSGIVGAYATLAANIFAVTAAFNALRGAAQVQQVQAGLEAMGNRMGTTLSVAAAQVREISGMTLTVEQSLRSTAQISAAGFGTKPISDLAKVANDVSVALGRNMTDSMDRLTRGVIKLEPELLDELGLMTKLGESSARYANALGKSEAQLSNFEKRQGFMNAIVAEGTAKFGGLAEEAGNTRNLDRLGATFSDTTKEILNFINGAALPLAALFSNKGVLIGGMLLFASTISKQLLPGLSNLSIKTAQAAQEISNSQKEMIHAVPTSKGEPRALKSLRRALDNDKATTEHYSKALDAIVRKEALLNNQIETGYNKRTKLSAAQIAAKRDEVEVLELQRETVQKTAILDQEASARRTAATAIVAAGEKHRLAALQLTIVATKQYHASLEMANAAAGRHGLLVGILTKVRAGFFAAAVGARVLGAALTGALNVIGLVVTAVFLLVEGFKWIKEWWQGPDVKRFNEAIAEQEEILGQLNGRYEEMRRVQEARIPISQREAQIYKIMTNTIRENIEAYEKVKQAQDAVFGNKATVEVGQTREFETLKKLRDMGAPEIRKQIDEALGKQGLTGILDNADKQINKGTLEKLAKILSVDLRQGAVTLGDHINDLAEAFKEADQSIAEFNRNAIPSTPYDTVVKQLDVVANSLTNISINAANSDDYIGRMAHTLTGAGENMKKFFTVDTQGLIKTFNELDMKIQNQEAAGERVAATDRARKRELTGILAIRSSELYQVQEMFATAQHLVRQTDNQVKLEQVRLDKLNKFTALTGSSIRQRREAENKILQLQAAQLKAQTAIVERQMQMTKIEIQTNQILLQRNEIYQSLIASAIGLGGVTNENFLAVANERLIELNRMRNPRNAAEVDAEIAKLTTVIGQYQNIRGLNLRIRDLQDQQSGLATDIAATLERQTSQLVINAEANSTNAQTAAGNADKFLELQNERVKLQKTELDIQVRLQGRVKSTAEEYAEMINEQSKTLTAQKTAIANQTNATIQSMRLEQARAAGNKEEIVAYGIRIDAELELARIKMQNIDAQGRLNILEKFSFDTHKAGLEMQKDSLEYLQKEVDAQAEYLQLQREGRILTAEIARKRAGRADNEFSSRVDEIRAARDELQIATQQASMRKAVIRLEYALLEAQRQQMVWNLQAQREILGSNTEQGRQLSIVIRNLEDGAGSIAAAQEMATQAVDMNIRNLAQKLESIGLGEGSANNIGNGLRDFIKLRQEQSRAVRIAQEAQAAPIAEALDTHISPLVKSNDNLQVAVNDNVAATRALTQELANRRNAPMPTVEAASKSLLDYAKQAEAAGLRVSEMAERGGVGSGHKGRGHREGRAFDASIAGGRQDSTNPAFRAKMDALANKFVQQGLIVLWNGQRLSASGNRALTAGEGMHETHMHVEIPAGSARVVGTAVGAAIAPPIITAVEPPMVAVTEAAQSATDANKAVKRAANDNKPINVTGTRGTSAVPKDFESLAGYFSQLTGEGDFNMLAMFEEMAEKLGPEGQIVPTIINGINNISSAIINFQKVMASDSASFADKFVAGAAIAQQGLATISSLLQASSDARVAAIDREIAAEQKRDGKSAESVAKIQALERKKDAIQRKAFNVNKKLMMAQAVIATAAGIAQALTLGPIVGPIMAAVIGALGAAQIAIIAGTSYQSTASANFNQKSMPDTLTIGKRGDQVDVARHNTNLGGEISYLRGTRGTGSNSSNYAPMIPLGSAYGGPIPRGYGNYAYVTGEKGPEIQERPTPSYIRPANDDEAIRPINAEFHISAFDGQSVRDMLFSQRGDIIDMLREAANANGTRFMEDVNTSHLKKTNAVGATRI